MKILTKKEFEDLAADQILEVIGRLDRRHQHTFQLRKETAQVTIYKTVVTVWVVETYYSKKSFYTFTHEGLEYGMGFPFGESNSLNVAALMCSDLWKLFNELLFGRDWRQALKAREERVQLEDLIPKTSETQKKPLRI